MLLPQSINKKVKTPPIKIQGIKTKLIPFIISSLKWNGEGTYIEPFMGSGSVVFNIAPQKAILSDTNKHIIEFYNQVKNKKITPSKTKLFLEKEGDLLRKNGKEHYYEIRSRFNEKHSPLDFLFLNRSCFNGLMRFNSKGGFNVPFCQKPDRFRQAYITKICNQIKWVQSVIEDKDWQFICQDWKSSVSSAQDNDLIYCDPPYFGRSADYFNQWTENDADDLANTLNNTNASFAMSMWIQNKYRVNPKIKEWFPNNTILSYDHFYHVGASDGLRNKVEEGLILNN